MTGSPGPDVLAAFGADVAPVLLEGGQRTSWRSGDLVLKPVDDAGAHAWDVELRSGWSSAAGVEVPVPVRATDGSAAAHGWGASRWVDGATQVPGADPRWFRETAHRFHLAVRDVPRPDLLDGRDDPWAFGDRVAWEERPVAGPRPVVALVRRLQSRLDPTADLGPDQLVHGDLPGNVLRTPSGGGAVIDLSPYWRPESWALAVAAVDAVCWQGADTGLLDAWGDLPGWDQALLRAMIYRVTTRGRLAPDLVEPDLGVEVALVETLLGRTGRA